MQENNFVRFKRATSLKICRSIVFVRVTQFIVVIMFHNSITQRSDQAQGVILEYKMSNIVLTRVLQRNLLFCLQIHLNNKDYYYNTISNIIKYINDHLSDFLSLECLIICLSWAYFYFLLSLTFSFGEMFLSRVKFLLLLIDFYLDLVLLRGVRLSFNWMFGWMFYSLLSLWGFLIF